MRFQFEFAYSLFTVHTLRRYAIRRLLRHALSLASDPPAFVPRRYGPRGCARTYGGLVRPI